jgi:hypothetical protein
MPKEMAMQRLPLLATGLVLALVATSVSARARTGSSRTDLLASQRLQVTNEVATPMVLDNPTREIVRPSEDPTTVIIVAPPSRRTLGNDTPALGPQSDRESILEVLSARAPRTSSHQMDGIRLLDDPAVRAALETRRQHTPSIAILGINGDGVEHLIIY